MLRTVTSRLASLHGASAAVGDSVPLQSVLVRLHDEILGRSVLLLGDHRSDVRMVLRENIRLMEELCDGIERARRARRAAEAMVPGRE